MSKNKLLTTALLFGTATAVIHIGNRMISAVSQLKDILDTPEKKHYEWRLGKIFYTKSGHGKPLVLIHDTMPGSSGYEWCKVESYLASQYTVYNIDLLGCGRSDKPGITYTNFIYTQLICDFIHDVIGEPANVIASGFSSSFVSMGSIHDQDIFDKIIFVNPPSLKSLQRMPSKRNRMMKYFLDLPIFGTLVYNMIVSRENISNLFIEKLYYNPFHVDEDILDAYYESAHKGGYYCKYLYSSLYSRLMNININNALATTNTSIYIIAGAEEPNSENILAEYCEVNPAIETVSISKSRHLPQLEVSEKFLEQVGIFLQ